MKKFISIIGLLFITGFILSSRHYWNFEMDRQVDLSKHRIMSERIDLAKPGIFVWRTNSDLDIDDGGQPAELWLKIDGVDARRAQFGVSTNSPGADIELKAYSDVEGIGEVNRLAKAWGFPSNRPFLAKNSLSTALGGNSMEYQIGGLEIYPRDKIVIEIKILSPNPQLSTISPKLFLVARHERTVAYAGLTRMFCDLLIVISLFFLGWLFWRAEFAKPSHSLNRNL